LGLIAFRKTIQLQRSLQLPRERKAISFYCDISRLIRVSALEQLSIIEVKIAL
jgi:hypothetical protein